MKVLIVGSGGREHAIAWSVSQSKKVDKIYCAPGNGGISQIAECVDISAMEFDKLADFAIDSEIDLTIIGMDDPLVGGIVDVFEERGLRVFGPRKNAAIIEGSKSFSKDLMKKYNIPTAKYEVFTNSEDAIKYVKEQNTYPAVIKADGLALGKGVILAESEKEAVEAIHSMIDDKQFGESSSTIVVEEYLTGPEVSVLSFTDGKTVVPMISSMDHKRALDGDKGLNTGGMGTVAPNPYYTEDIAKECMEKIFLPTINAMNAEGRTFEGCLYFGLMLTPNGPKVIEYNCRFGDPETQVVLPMLEGDLCEIFEAIYEHRLADVKIGWKSGYCTCVVMASGGYPVKYKKGIEMFGMDDKGQVDGAFIYHAGTKYEDGKFYTNGGRVLGVTCNAYTLQGALDKSYEAVSKIKFEGEHFRKDIGQKALKALPKDSLDLEYKQDMEDYIEENGVYLRQ